MQTRLWPGRLTPRSLVAYQRAAAGAAALLALLALAAPAHATICDVDVVPAATLLLPYFEVDLDDPNGLTTLFSVNNASAVATLAHVVVWSDLAVPILDFDVYLTGYDVQTINLRDVLVRGSLPQTATATEDPADVVSPKGPFSQDVGLPGCAGKLPPPPAPADYLAHVQAALTGRPSPLFAGLCTGRYLGDDVARGYVTVDTVRRCTLLVPGDPGYFGPAGDATDLNVLWGTWYIVASAHNYAQGSAMVAIEASATDPATTTAGRYTFYGRYDGWTAIDHREPLATAFAAQYAAGGPFSGRADAIVWRDPKVAQGPFPCPPVPGLRPAWYPLTQEGLQVFDEQEHAITRPLFPIGPPQAPPTPAPAAAQRTQIGGAGFPVPFDFGWIYFDLNGASAAAGANPAGDPAAAQGWVLTVQSADGRFATAIDALRLDSACAASHFGGTISAY